MISKNTFFGLIFCLFVLLVVFWKKILWAYWKYKRSKSKEQISDLLAKHSFIEITGPSQSGKSWGLSHVFKHLEGVKLTNMPTPNGTYTINEEILLDHMVSNWGVPHRWYYFLDDITTFQTWAKNKWGEKGYLDLQKYIGKAGKLGAVFVWTNNGVEVDPIFATNKNATWKIQWYFTFSKRYSLLVIKTSSRWYNFFPTILAIDNEEIANFYDKYWNIPRENQKNFVNYTTKGTGARELDSIVEKIEDTNGIIDWNNETVKKIEEYIKLKKSEARKKYGEKAKKDKLHQDLKDFGLDPNKPITGEEIARLEKKGRFKYLKEEGEKNKENKNKKFSGKTKQENSEEDENSQINLDLLDLDKKNQDSESNDNGESNN